LKQKKLIFKKTRVNCTNKQYLSNFRKYKKTDLSLSIINGGSCNKIVLPLIKKPLVFSLRRAKTSLHFSINVLCCVPWCFTYPLQVLVNTVTLVSVLVLGILVSNSRRLAFLPIFKQQKDGEPNRFFFLSLSHRRHLTGALHWLVGALSELTREVLSLHWISHCT
jgi:hypothetical protein